MIATKRSLWFGTREVWADFFGIPSEAALAHSFLFTSPGHWLGNVQVHPQFAPAVRLELRAVLPRVRLFTGLAKADAAAGVQSP